MGSLDSKRFVGVIISVVSVVVAFIMLTIVVPNINTILDRTTLDTYHTGTAGLLRLLPLLLVVGIMGLAGTIGFQSIRGEGRFGGGVGTGQILSIVGGFVFLVIGLVAFPIMLDTIVTLNQPGTGLADFTGVLNLINIVPLIYTVGLMALSAGTIYLGSSGGGSRKKK